MFVYVISVEYYDGLFLSDDKNNKILGVVKDPKDALGVIYDALPKKLQNVEVERNLYVATDSYNNENILTIHIDKPRGYVAYIQKFELKE